MKGKWPYLTLTVCLLAFGYLFILNPNQVSFRLYRGTPVQTNLALVVFLAFLSGFGAAFLTGLGQEAFYSLRLWRHRRREERRERGRGFFLAGRGHLAGGRPKAAGRALRKAYRSLPGDPAVAMELARADAAQQQFAAAEARLQSLLADEPRNPEVLSLLLDIQRRRSDGEAQRETLGRWLQVDPDHMPSLRALRDLYRAEQKWPEAIRVQERVLAKSEGHDLRSRERRQLSELRLLWARGLAPLRAQEQLKSVVAADGDFAPGHAALGDTLLAQGDEEAACRQWLRGYDATHEAGLLLRAEPVRVRQGRADEMLRLYRRIGKRDGIGGILRARLLIGLNRSEEALEVLEKLEGATKRAAAAAWLTGEALFRLRSFDRSARAFRRGVGADERSLPLPFSCAACGATAREWSPACVGCGTLDTVHIELRVCAGSEPASGD